MNFVSCFSGIEAASAAWHPLGFKCLGVAEFDAFPCAVLAHHYPDVPNLGDVLADDFLERVASMSPDVVVGGPPCQDFSVAGLRAGLNGHRGNLTLRWVQIIHASRARFAVTENVPGWLSANSGHAFGAFLAGLVGHDTALLPPKDCGGRWTNAGMVAGPDGRACWRVLDAQFFGLAQRRKRVFVVFCPGDGTDPSEILLEQKSLRGDPAPRRASRERVAASLTRGADSSGKGGYAGRRREDDENLVAGTLESGANRTGGTRPPGTTVDTADSLIVSMALNAHGGSGRMDGESETFVPTTLFQDSQYGVGEYDSAGSLRAGRIPEHQMVLAHSLRADGFDASEDGTGRGTPLVPVTPGGDTSKSYWKETDVANTVAASKFPYQGTRIAYPNSMVRRLTPRECERLQGFPDDYTAIPYRGKPAADGSRYRALGNSMAVPVMAWIGARIQQVAA